MIFIYLELKYLENKKFYLLILFQDRYKEQA